ncbi:DUF7344 domain-containing protein [Halorussus halobius]|uniref:DUF7344 domain-containing protein n=1 Tax=Halorussus halobius TaxID=1710537 RepID=UPI0010920C80|nr:hypothetical protein [Halorussus halobius]
MVEGGSSSSDDASDLNRARDADATFEVLADERRRLALHYLRDRGSADVDELATVVSGWTRARRAEAETVTPGEREAVRIDLHHVHLPRLVDAGVVDYDRDAGVARLGEPSDLLVTVLDRSLADERRWANERRAEGGRDEDPQRGDDA